MLYKTCFLSQFSFRKSLISLLLLSAEIQSYPVSKSHFGSRPVASFPDKPNTDKEIKQSFPFFLFVSIPFLLHRTFSFTYSIKYCLPNIPAATSYSLLLPQEFAWFPLDQSLATHLLQFLLLLV